MARDAVSCWEPTRRVEGSEPVLLATQASSVEVVGSTGVALSMEVVVFVAGCVVVVPDAGDDDER